MPARWMSILLTCLAVPASGCAVLSGETPTKPETICTVDKPIGFAAGDTEETKRRIVEHDRRLYCLCPDVYPEKHEQMECPKR